MSIRRVPLDITPLRQLDLQIWDGDGDRFVRLFREVWFQLPVTVQEKILEHWTEDNPYVLLQLSNGWTKSTTHYGVTGVAGREIKFNAYEVDQMPDVEAKFLIAHELAHVYQYAVGTHQQSYDDLESDANDRAINWGFDQLTWSEWKAKRECEQWSK